MLMKKVDYSYLKETALSAFFYKILGVVCKFQELFFWPYLKQD